VLLDSFPPSATIQLHPVVFTILDFASVLERLSEEISQKVVVRGVLKSEVANVAEILVELLCRASVSQCNRSRAGTTCDIPGKPSHKSFMAVVCFFSPIFSYFCLLVALDYR
jgi:hypothetical protein